MGALPNGDRVAEAFVRVAGPLARHLHELYIACAEHDNLAPLPMVEELRTLFGRAGIAGEIERKGLPHLSGSRPRDENVSPAELLASLPTNKTDALARGGR